MVVTKDANVISETHIKNWIGGEECSSAQGQWFPKKSPHTGHVVFEVARSTKDDVVLAVGAASGAQEAWANTTPIKRGEILYAIANRLEAHSEEMARIVALETGKSLKDALGEVGAAIAQGRFMAGEGARLYGHTATSGMSNKYTVVTREPVGVVALIIAANTPIANVAWKVFPALICGNAVVLKAAEDTPMTAWYFAKLAKEAGLPAGVLNVVQGYGVEVGDPLVRDPRINLISFTGSTKVGCQIATIAAERLARVSLELGGKNPLVVCDDADLENAVKWVLLSAFSNAGQRCAAASRIIMFASIYDEFKRKLIEKTQQLRVGPSDSDDLGPVINEKQLNNMLQAVKNSQKEGATVLVGGTRCDKLELQGGYYMAPTLLESVDPAAAISQEELFGPIACLYRVANFKEAIALANNAQYGLTAAIHTKNINRALEFSKKVQTGVVVTNAGTHGSEPHMPFGGRKLSGNGTREPGTEALNVYSEFKNVSVVVNPDQI